MHAMRGISAHSNGFHTCRAIHLLQMLLGTIDTPGGFRYKSPFPKPIPPGPKPAGRPDQIAPGTPMAGAPLGFPRGPEDLIVEPDGTPRRIDKAFSWDAPVAAHGMMHIVIRNAWPGDPYPIDVLFMYMANMAWNSAMNSDETASMLTAKKPGRQLRHPKDHLCRCLLLRDRGLCRPDPAGHHLSRALRLHLAARPADRLGRWVGRLRSASRCVEPDRDVRPFQDVLIDLGARLGLPAFVDEDGAPALSRRLSRLHGQPRAQARHRPARRLARRRTATSMARARRTRTSSSATSTNGCFFSQPIPAEARYFKHANQAYLDFAEQIGLIDGTAPIILQLYSEPLQRFRLAARGHGAGAAAGRQARADRDLFRSRCPSGTRPSTRRRSAEDAFPLHAVTQRPMYMYHCWGGQNPWLRQILSRNRLYLHRATAAALGIADDDWVGDHQPARPGRGPGQADGRRASATRSGPGTPSASARAPGASRVTRRKPSEGFLLNP